MRGHAKRRRGNRILSGVFIGVGLVTALVAAPWCAWHAHVEASWPVATGEVRECAVTYRSARRPAPHWQVALAYEFAVDGRRLTGRDWAWGHQLHYWARADAEEHARRLAPGTAVDVHYDPEDPSAAVLALESEHEAWLALGGGLFFLAIGVVSWRRGPPGVPRY